VGLLGSWTFDEEEAFDFVEGRSIDPNPHAGPGLLGFGASAFLNKHAKTDKKQYYTITNLSFPLQEWTTAFWIFLLPDTSDAFVSILHQGNKLFPHLSVLLWPQTPRLRIKFGDTSLDTISTLTMGHWTQVTIMKGGGIGRIYINGLLDTQIILGKMPSIDTEGLVYLGGSMWHHSVYAYIDNLKFYSRALSPEETTAIASLGFPSLLAGSSLPSLGCNRCSLQRAMTVCGSKLGSHLCSIHELNSYALLVSRLLGWIRLYHTHRTGEPTVEIHVWNHEQGALLHQSQSSSTINTTKAFLASHVGYGLCCPDH